MKYCLLLSCLLCFSIVSPQARSQSQTRTQNQTQAQATAKETIDPITLPYGNMSFARAFGNVGGWWSFMNENEKAAFLDGYQAAMKQALGKHEILCKVLRDSVKPTSNQDAFMAEMKTAIFVCSEVHELADYQKVTTKDLDDFYATPINQPILL
jgi:hypothetical protein